MNEYRILTTRYPEYIIGDKSDDGQDARCEFKREIPDRRSWWK